MAAAILTAWAGGMTLLVRREFFVGNNARLAEAALRIAPGATFFLVEQGGKQIGFASNTIDTTTTGIDVIDYFIADLPIAGAARRASARSVVKLSRGLALRAFDVQVESQGVPIRVSGRAEGDTAIVYALTSGPNQKADSQRIAVKGPIVLPTLVPLAVALGDQPRVGRQYLLPTFNPSTMASGTIRLRIRAESVFTLVDSAAFDTASGVWLSALTDTVRAWRVEPEEASGGFTGWIDAQGRVVQSSQPGGITLRRMAYEMAFENWRIARDRATASNAGSGANDILERTAIAAGANLGRSRLEALAVRLSAVDLRGFDLAGGRQTMTGDTLRVRREHETDLVPSWSLLKPEAAFKMRFRAEIAPEPLLQSGDSRIVTLAIRIAGADRDPRVLAEKINRWVHDSLKKEITFSVPNAIEVLRTRKGDCDEHTQLYAALARALGIPQSASRWWRGSSSS